MARLLAFAAALAVVASACDGGPSRPGNGEWEPGPAVRLVLSGAPAGATAGLPFDAVVVSAQDAHGNYVAAPLEVTLAATSGTLLGTTTRATAGGIAVFDDLRLTRAGPTTLVASAPGLEGVETAPFTVVAGYPAALTFTAQPPATVEAGATLPDVTVAAADAYGNAATNGSQTVTLALSAAALGGTSTVALADGVATFRGLTVTAAGEGYTLSASCGGVAPVASGPFDVTPAAADRLVFAVEPTPAAAGDVLQPPVEVRVEDRFGNLAPAAVDVTLAAETLGGTTTATSVGGVATFADLRVTRAGSTALTATAGELAAATSAAFVIQAGALASLEFVTQPPATVAAGATIPTVRVMGRDAYGNEVPSAPLVSISVDGAELLGWPKTVSILSGRAEFSGLSIRKAGTAYRLTATSPGDVSAATSAPFAVTAGPGHHLAFVSQPAGVGAGGTLPPVEVGVFDTYENRTPVSGSITIGFSAASSGFPVLYGTKTRPLVGGTATFDDLSVRKAGTGYRFAANGAALPGVASDPFDVVPGGATKLAFLVQPTSIRSGEELSPAIQVAITDEWLNLAATAEREISLALEPGAGDAVLAGPTTLETSGGVATFEGLTVREPGSAYAIRATAAGLADAVSGTFGVSPNWVAIGPDGGDITALATDPASSYVAYAATAGCVWKTVNGGSSWTRACDGLSLPMRIDALAVHPSSSDQLFAATSMGLFRSRDAGASWSAVASLGATAPYRTLAVAVAASGGIYAGTFDQGLWRSDDGGTTWTRLAAGLPAPRITAVAIEPASTEVLYAAGVDASYVGTVYRSVDRGDTWTETALGPAAFPGVQPTSVLVDPSAVDSLVVGTETGIYESPDRGGTFAEAYSGAAVRDLAAHGPLRTRFAAGTSTVLRRQDGGPWQQVSTGLPAEPNAVAVAVRSNGTALLGTRYGVHDRTSSGTSWLARTSGIRALDVTAVGAARSGGTVLYAATSGGGVYRSLDGGSSWQRGSHPAERQVFHGIAVERSNPLRAWLAGSSRLYRTTDGGVTWTESVLPSATLATILDPVADAIVYAGGTADVFRSANSGGSFRDLNVCGGPMRRLALSAAAPLALWVGGDAGLCRVDLGRVDEIAVPSAWQPGTSGVVEAVAIDPDPALAGSTVFASTSDGFHATVDGGATWTRTADRFDALLAQRGRLFGARQGGALEVSRDGGATFGPSGVGLHHGHVRTLAEVPGFPDEIYAGTSWGSVFKTTSGGE